VIMETTPALIGVTSFALLVSGCSLAYFLNISYTRFLSAPSK